MSKIFKSFTIWFALISLTVIIIHMNGMDPANQILTFSNYPLFLVLKASQFTLYTPDAVDHSFYFAAMATWYKWHIISLAAFGLIIDLDRSAMGKKVKNK